jgi:hypothetical protein
MLKSGVVRQFPTGRVRQLFRQQVATQLRQLIRQSVRQLFAVVVPAKMPLMRQLPQQSLGLRLVLVELLGIGGKGMCRRSRRSLEIALLLARPFSAFVLCGSPPLSY